MASLINSIFHVQLTTSAAEQGDMGAETIALEIGEYFDEVRQLI